MWPLVLQVVSMGAVGRSSGQWLGVRVELQGQKVARPCFFTQDLPGSGSCKGGANGLVS